MKTLPGAAGLVRAISDRSIAVYAASSGGFVTAASRTIKDLT